MSQVLNFSFKAFDIFVESVGLELVLSILGLDFIILSINDILKVADLSFIEIL